MGGQGNELSPLMACCVNHPFLIFYIHICYIRICYWLWYGILDFLILNFLGH